MRLPSPAERHALGPLAGASARFLLVVVAGWLAWAPLGASFASVFSELASATLSGADFGRGGHAEFFRDERAQTASAQRDSSWDTSVELSIEGVQKTHVIAINPRRLAYLPLLFFAAFLAAAPLPARRKAEGMLLGIPLLLLLALGSVWITIAWLFARVPGLVYDLAPWQRSTLHLLYEGFVTPIANKFIAPLLLVLAILAWRKPQPAVIESKASAQTATLTAPRLPRAPGSRRRRKR